MGKVVAFRSLRGIQRQVSADEIVELRQALDWSQERLARDLGCSLSAVQKWEYEERQPTGAYLERLLDLLAEAHALRNLRPA